MGDVLLEVKTQEEKDEQKKEDSWFDSDNIYSTAD